MLAPVVEWNHKEAAAESYYCHGSGSPAAAEQEPGFGLVLIPVLSNGLPGVGEGLPVALRPCQGGGDSSCPIGHQFYSPLWEGLQV